MVIIVSPNSNVKTQFIVLIFKRKSLQNDFDIKSTQFAYSMSNFVITLSVECLLKANGFIMVFFSYSNLVINYFKVKVRRFPKDMNYFVTVMISLIFFYMQQA